MKLKNRIITLALLMFVMSCASKKQNQVTTEPKPGEAPSDILSALPLEPVVKVEGEDLDVSGGSTDENSNGEQAGMRPRAPVIGVWIDSVGLDAFWALGYLQELDRAGVKVSKVVGQGFACWLALSWAQHGSANQAEWQAFKWSSWEPIGLDAGFLKRLTGNTANYENFESQIKRWMPEEKFSALKLKADCPLVDSRHSYALASARSLGIQKTLWFQMRQPFFAPPMEPQASDAYLSAWSYGNLRPQDYDQFSRDSGQNVDFWIHLRTVPANTWAQSDPWLIAAASKDEWERESWFRTPEGRWVLRKTLYQVGEATKSNVLDFARRRAFLLEGRKMGKQWINGEWFQNNLRDSFSAE